MSACSGACDRRAFWFCRLDCRGWCVGFVRWNWECVVALQVVAGDGWQWSVDDGEILVLDAAGTQVHRLTGDAAVVATLVMDSRVESVAHLPVYLLPAGEVLIDLGLIRASGERACDDRSTVGNGAGRSASDAGGSSAGGDVGGDVAGGGSGVSRRRVMALGAAAAAVGVVTVALPGVAAAASGDNPPEPVTTLTVVAVSGSFTSVRANWTASAGATGYSVRHRKTGDLEFGDAVVVSAATVDITGLTPETSYDVQVVATSVGGSSDPAVAVGFTQSIATGGSATRTVVDGDDYVVRTFTSAGSLVLATDWSLEYLVVAGGGGGGGDNGGGGGGGGLRTNLTSPISAEAATYPVAVGAGGAGGASNVAGTTGGDSSVLGVTAAGGGGGGTGEGTGPNGKPGGSGGGAGGEVASATGGTGNTPFVLPSQGTNGGNGLGSTGGPGAGGGGATAAGGNATAGAGGAGGDGAVSTISGTTAQFAGGGGGGSDNGGVAAAGAGGTGGGGAGGASTSAGVAGTASTGGGGGGGGQGGAGAVGGSGVVIVRYPLVREPLTVSGTPTGDGQATVTWSWVGDSAVQSYRVEQTADNGSNWTVLEATTTATSLVVNGLTNGATYRFRVTPTVAGVAGKSMQTTDVVLVPTATGGTVTTTTVEGTDYLVHTFTTSGTFALNYDRDVEYLIVAGGGGGAARDAAGGGGGGGLRANVGDTALARTAASYPVVVGAGGAGFSNINGLGVGGSGGVSSVFGLSAAGGGGGGGYDRAGVAGGSGGGSGRDSATQPAGNTPATTPSQGNSGGRGSTSMQSGAGGGGGGAGAAGSNAANGGAAGNGGDGREINITGTATYFAGGGGGTMHRSNTGTNGTGGLGGGGNGAAGGAGALQTGQPGVANTGGGGGAARGDGATATGGNGGSGIVIIRYPVQAPAPEPL
jgi:hypothetical protein